MGRSVSKLFLVVTILISACANPSENRPTSFITPSQFQTYSCEELLKETERIQDRVNKLIGQPSDSTLTQGKWVLGADLSISWAALFALGGTQEQEAEYVQLKSEYDAIQHWAVIKQCPGVVPPAEKPPEFDPDMVQSRPADTLANQR